MFLTLEVLLEQTFLANHQAIILMLPLLFLASIFLLLFVLLQKHTKDGAKPPSLHPPGPKGLPLIGNLHQFDPLTTHLYFSQLSETYGPLVFLRLGHIPTLVVSSAKLAKEVLKTQDQIFCSRPLLTGHKKLSYNGFDVAFGPYNDYWREMRKICIIQLFSSKRVQYFSPIQGDEVGRMVREIYSFASTSKVVSLSKLAMSLSSSIICRIGFGKSYGDDKESKARIRRFHRVFNDAQGMFMKLFLADYFPYMGWVDKITGASRKLQKVFMEMDELYQELIDEHLDPNKKKPDREDIIDVLLQLRKEQSTPFDLTLDRIKGVLMNIVIGGTDTTAATIVWAMTELIKHPNAMKKVQEEVRSLITEQNGRNKNFITEEDLHQLVYLKAVVKETFRLHPAVPLLVPHQSLKPCTLEGYDIEPRTMVYINVWAIGRDPKSWEDPESFMPERFLGSHIDFKGQDFELIPFGSGRRSCPAMLMGAVTIELALANLLCWFDWELPNGMKKEDINMDALPGIAVLKK